MKKLFFILLLVTIAFTDEFKNIKYEIIASNNKYVTILIEESGTVTAQTVIDYIVAAETEYPIEFVSAVTAYAYIFKKVEKE